MYKIIKFTITRCWSCWNGGSFSSFYFLPFHYYSARSGSWHSSAAPFLSVQVCRTAQLGRWFSLILCPSLLYVYLTYSVQEIETKQKLNRKTKLRKSYFLSLSALGLGHKRYQVNHAALARLDLVLPRWLPSPPTSLLTTRKYNIYTFLSLECVLFSIHAKLSSLLLI